MNLRQIRFLFIKTYKTIDSLDPYFMKKIFEMKKNNRVVRKKIYVKFEYFCNKPSHVWY